LDNQIEILKEVFEDHVKNNIDELEIIFNNLMKKMAHSKSSQPFFRILQTFQTFSEFDE
jgi:F0F1-type ATP synthase gamma subunit